MTTLAKVSSVPRAETRPPYMQIVEHFQRRITTGDLAAGDPMPSISELAKEWGVAHSTVVRAVRILRDDNWIVSSQGRPSVVADRSPP